MSDLPTRRRLLAEATPLPWMAYGRGVVNDQYDDVIATKTEGAPWMEREVLVLSDADREAIVAIINAAPQILQAAEEGERAASTTDRAYRITITSERTVETATIRAETLWRARVDGYTDIYGYNVDQWRKDRTRAIGAVKACVLEDVAARARRGEDVGAVAFVVVANETA